MKEIFHLLAKNGVSPNGLFVLSATRDQYMIAGYVNHSFEQYKLEMSGHLTFDTFGDKIFKITPKGFDLLKQVDEIYGQSPEPDQKPVKRKAKKGSMFTEWEEKLREYNELFPKGKKEGTSVSFRTNPKELCERFEWFFEEYPEYNWDDVMEATRRYVKPFNENMDYTYMQASKYFVKKEDKSKTITSTLATMCYNIAEGNDAEVDSGFHYFGP